MGQIYRGPQIFDSDENSLCTYTLNVGRIEIAEVGDNRDVVHLR